MIAQKLREAVIKSVLEGRFISEQPPKYSATQILATHGISRVEDQSVNLPENWALTNLGSLAEIRIGKTPKRTDPSFWTPQDIPWVSISDMVQGGTISRTKESISQDALDSVFRSRTSPAGTLLMSFKLSIGRCSFLGIDAVHNEAIISIFPRTDHVDLVSKYLCFMLPLISQQGKTKSAIKGATLNKDSLSKLLIPFPPYEDQEVIIRSLSSVFETINELAVLERERERI